MLYDPETGKRVKEPFTHITWAHKSQEMENYNLQQCYFGEHLLKSEPKKPVALVESEKTAIISSVYFPQFIWLAVGSLTNLNAEKCKPLQGRSVYLFADLKGYDKWNIKIQELTRQMPGTRFMISDLLEKKASPAERDEGLDLADYLIRFDWRLFTQQQKRPEQSIPLEQ